MNATTQKIRKHTRFVMCGKHAPWFAGNTRSRNAECFVEGGPAGSGGCAGGRCRLWPGTDFYSKEYCHDELELDWTKDAAAMLEP